MHRFAVDRRRAGKPVSKRLSLSLRDQEFETGSNGRSGFGSGRGDRTHTGNSNTGSTNSSISGVTEAAIAAWILVFALLLHFFSLVLSITVRVRFSSVYIFPSLFDSAASLLSLFLPTPSLSFSFSPPPPVFPIFSYFFFFSFCFLFFFLLLFFLVLLPFARKLVHIRIGGRSSAARSLIKSHKNREAVSSPASYGNREVEPVLNIDSGSSLYTECIRREPLLMLNEF